MVALGKIEGRIESRCSDQVLLLVLHLEFWTGNGDRSLAEGCGEVSGHDSLLDSR